MNPIFVEYSPAYDSIKLRAGSGKHQMVQKNMTANVYKGIAASLSDSTNVHELYIEAKEADSFFYWASSSEKSALKLKVHFPNLKKVMIEDDYLTQTQVDALEVQLLPLEIKWEMCGYVDGRHGR